MEFLKALEHESRIRRERILRRGVNLNWPRVHRRAGLAAATKMDPNRCCPLCPEPSLTCPHLLICMGGPGEALGGALADRLKRLWGIMIVNVGDDPALDARGVYADSWRDLRDRFTAEAALVIEGDRWTAIYLQDATRMEAVVEACIAADEL